MRKGKSTPLGEFLQTEDPAEQLVRVQQLALRAQLRPITLVIQVHAGQVQVAVIGETISYDDAHRILELAGQELRRQEREALAKQTQASEAAPENSTPSA